MNKHISNLLASPSCTAAEMTHQLRLAGDGEMCIGIRNLWLNGFGKGFLASAAVIGGSILVYWLATQNRRFIKQREAMGAAFSRGVAYALRKENKDLEDKTDSEILYGNDEE